MTIRDQMTDAELIAELGSDGYAEAVAVAYDAVWPALGDTFRAMWREIRATIQANEHRAIAELCGADHELAYYPPPGGQP